MRQKPYRVAIGIAICVVAGIAVLEAAYFLAAFKRGDVRAAERFLDLLAHDDVHDAYLSTSRNFQLQVDEESFAAAVKRLGLVHLQYKYFVWNTPSVEDGVVSLQGSMITHDAPAMYALYRSGPAGIAVNIKLVREERNWRVSAIAQPHVTKTRNGLVNESLLDLDEAIKTKDFTSFYKKIAMTWQRETTPEALKHAFGHFLDKPVDLAFRYRDPFFDRDQPPAPPGTLAISGRFPGQSDVLFSLRYTNEPRGPACPITFSDDPSTDEPNWKLVGIKVGTNRWGWASASKDGVSLSDL
jgi:hypothetical protein